MSSPSQFVEALLTAARGTLGIRETTHNSGPEIDDWLRYVHSTPGNPWCAAWVSTMHDYAAKACGIVNPCPRTARALAIWGLCDPAYRSPLPAPGDVFVLDTGAEGGAGHVGIVEVVSPDGRTLTTIEGNSNEAGSREGNAVVRHIWRPTDNKRGRLLGFVTFANAVPVPAGVEGLPPQPWKAGA